MATNIESKTAVVSKSPAELYMSFVDMRNFLQFLPEDKKEGVIADYDSIHATVQGFDVGVKINERVPYSRIDFSDDGAPFQFNVSMHFDAASSDPYKTSFHIEFNAELNLMMKMMIGKKIKKGLDKMVEGLAAVSEGRLPDGISEDDIRKAGFDNPFNK